MNRFVFALGSTTAMVTAVGCGGGRSNEHGSPPGPSSRTSVPAPLTAPPASPAAPMTLTYHDELAAHLGRRSGGSPILFAVSLLLSRPSRIDDARVRSAVESVFGADVVSRLRPPAESGLVRTFDAPCEQFMLSVQEVKRPYPTLEALDYVNYIITDPEALRSFAEHRCFLSVHMLVRSKDGKDDAYAKIARLAAEFWDDTVRCVHCRDAGVYLAATNDVRQVLLGNGAKTALDFFMDRRSFAVRGDDVAMETAMATARGRLPEFLKAWSARQPGDSFMFKGRFENAGRIEHMWMIVESIADEQVTGELVNTPHFAKHLREGERITVPMAGVSDWVYSSGKGAEGGWTDPMMRSLVTMLGDRKT